MFDFIPLTLIMISLGGIIVMVLRKTRSLTLQEMEAVYSSPQFINKLRNFWKREVVDRFPREEIEARIMALTEKFLRKVRIMTLKLEHFLTRRLEKIQEARKSVSASNGAYWAQVKTEANVAAASGILESSWPVPEKEHPIFIEWRLLESPHATVSDYKNLARLYLAGKNFSDGRRVLLRCWRRSPKDPDVISLLDDIRENEGKTPMDANMNTNQHESLENSAGLA